MAKIASKVLWFGAVQDAAFYNVRVVPDGQPFSYADTPKVRAPHDSSLSEIDVDLAGLSLAEGVYDIYVTAEDTAGNESDPLPFADAVLDFTPPSAPAAGGFR